MPLKQLLRLPFIAKCYKKHALVSRLDQEQYSMHLLGT